MLLFISHQLKRRHCHKLIKLQWSVIYLCSCHLGITLACSFNFWYASYFAKNPLHEKQQHLHDIILHNYFIIQLTSYLHVKLELVIYKPVWAMVTEACCPCSCLIIYKQVWAMVTEACCPHCRCLCLYFDFVSIKLAQSWTRLQLPELVNWHCHCEVTQKNTPARNKTNYLHPVG